MPSHISQVAVKRAVDDYKNYLASLKAYSKNKANFLGMPRAPNYKHKDSRLTYELDKNRLTKEGYLARVITKNNINTFSSIKDKSGINKLFTCSQKKDLINSEIIDFYNKFSFNKVIKETICKVQQRDNSKLLEYEKQINKNNKIKSKVEFVGFKFIPNDKYLVNSKPKVIVQAVLKHTVDLPENNLLNHILKNNKKFLDLNDLDKVKFIQGHFSKDNYNIASMDIGVVNHASMAFNSGSKAIVIAGKNYNNYVKNKNLQLDELKSKLIPQAIKDIQIKYSKIKIDYEKINSKPEDWETRIIKGTKGKQDKILTCLKSSKLKELIKNKDYPRLSKADKLLLSESSLAVYSNPSYVNKLTSLNNYKQNYLHKLSSSIIDLCNFNQIQYLVIGKNDLWKQASHMNTENNKDFHSMAHTDLINYIKYKALLFGIVVLVTEESYTSRTSFVNGSKLLKFNGSEIIKKEKIKTIDESNKNKIDKSNQDLKNKGIKITKTNDSTKANPKSKKTTTFGGYRQSRGVYVNESKYNKGYKPHQILIHADVNASYNIMCKVFKQIKYNPMHHELTYKIMSVQSNKNRLKLLM